MITVPAVEDRYDRQRRITWWDQDVLAAARVLVVGAGALGNELLKNLVLLGVGHVTVIDLDTIEPSNLARCALFRDADAGAAKAVVAARRAAELNPQVEVVGRFGSVMAVGLGELRDFDLVIGGLDNREARAWVNQACRKLRLTWVDGAIEGLRGIVRAFPPDGACYECTLGEVDREILARRQSCALLTSDEMAGGKVPTTASSAAVVAGIQVQEAVKLLHGRHDLLALANKAFIYLGETLETYLVSYSEDPDCLVHDTYDGITPVLAGGDLTLADLAALHTAPGDALAIDFESELVAAASCGCGDGREIGRFVHALTPADVRCSCGSMPRLDARRSVAPDDPWALRSIRALGLADRDVVTVRTADRRWHYEVALR